MKKFGGKIWKFVKFNWKTGGELENLKNWMKKFGGKIWKFEKSNGKTRWQNMKNLMEKQGGKIGKKLLLLLLFSLITNRSDHTLNWNDVIVEQLLKYDLYICVSTTGF